VPADPSDFSALTTAYGGWLRSAKINGVTAYCDSATLDQGNNYQYTRYALTLPTGNRQKVLHTRGTREVSWSISGDLTTESSGLLNFLHPYYRGLIFPVAVLQSGYQESDYIASAMMENFSLQGAADGTIKYSISGKGLTNIVGAPSWTVTGHRHPVPGWASGNTLVRSWSVTHSISLQANWHNSQQVLPTYYRPAESEYTMQIQTLGTFAQYDTISLGVGTFTFVQGLVTKRAINYSGNDPKMYDCQVTNVHSGDEAITPAVAVTIGGGYSPPDWI